MEQSKEVKQNQSESENFDNPFHGDIILSQENKI